ncbi:MAG: CDP-glycerol glycerophosphotransferase family protein [Gemmatimonadetes bacterium]|nr:CDP-glycerol glycerophosphotransferase family protein [Gemmatimonadota bacterium]
MRNVTARAVLFGTQSYAVGVLAPLADALRRRGSEVAWLFEGPGAEHVPRGEHVLEGMADARRWGSDVAFVSSDSVPHFLPGLKVAVFHGLDARKRPDDRGHFRIRGYFDLYCTHGPSTTGPFRALAARHGHFEVVETGFPKLDPALRAPTPRTASEPIVLYAPTMTPGLSSADALLPTLASLAAKGRWRWRVKLHAKAEPRLRDAYGALIGPHLELVDDPDLVRVMTDAHVMLSDTSSAPVEFVVLGRPAVTFRHREPGPWFIDVREPAEVEGAIIRALADPPDLRAAMERFASEVHPWRDGRSADRVVDAALDLLGRGTGHLRRKPLNLWRKVQARWRWRWWGGAGWSG